MKTDLENNEWKAEAPYLASLHKENPFCVPENYFKFLPDTISNTIYTEKLREAVPVSGFAVPEQYFSSARARIIAATAENVLQNLPEVTGYTAPDLYFQKLQSRILAQTTGLKETEAIQELPVKSVSKIIRLWNSDVLKYASAACFILVTAFGLYLNQQSFTKQASVADFANEQLLYDLDEQDIIDHIETNAPETSKNMEINEELETYILNNYSQSDLSSAIN